MTSKKLHEPENWKFRTFKSKSGATLRYGFTKPQGESKGTVVVTGGYGRHIEYYFEQINNWLDRGYTVYAMDWDGQGGSGRENPARRYLPPTKDFDQHVEDFHDFVSSVVKPVPEKPAFLCSHSKGGNIMLRYLHKYEKIPGFPFSGAILGTPLIRLNTQSLSHDVFKRAVHLLDRAGLTHAPLPSLPKLLIDFRDAVLGRSETCLDEERERVHEGYKHKTEHYEIGFPTVGWLREAIKSCETVMSENFLENIHTPVLILSSAMDSLVSVDAQKEAARLMPNGKQVTFRGARHGIWYDIDAVQEKMWREIDHFLSFAEARFMFRHARNGPACPALSA